MAEAGVAVAAARRELVRGLDGGLAQAPRPSRARAWRSTARSRAGWTSCRRSRPSSAWPRRSPPAARTDAETGGAAIGPHRSDLDGRATAPRGEAGARCSTGRQKACLISIVPGRGAAALRRHGDLPILLLDEVAAHLDPRRRAELLDELGELGRAGLADRHRGRACSRPCARRAQFFHVVNGALSPHD